MAGANSNIQFADLDFADIKNGLTTFLKSQSTFKDYNFSGSGLSVLLDILAYNTQYNAYYLNMVGNEMFLDTALQRSSVVSQAKTLNYIPKSAIAPSAEIDLIVNQVSSSSLTLPKFTNFVSEAIDGVNYNFVTIDSKTVNTSANTATFSGVVLKQGTPVNYSFTADTTANPSSTFEIPDENIDTTTLQVSVQQSGTNTSTTIYNNATDYLMLDGTSQVYFLQEGLNGYYEIYFGDGIIGKKLVDGNIIKVSYVSTEGAAAAGANSFILLDQVSGFANTTINPLYAATTGGGKESISSIKFQAPKAYAAQNRAVTQEDYITLIQQNKIGISFDAVNVWGGQQNNPPVYGQVFVCLKPTGSYALTAIQKQRIMNEVLKPISVMTVEPNIIDPDYVYLQLTANVLYDPKKTSLTSNQLRSAVIQSMSSFTTKTLNTFNSTFVANDLSNAIQGTDQSIIANELFVKAQKKFNPNLVSPTTYQLNFGVPLTRGLFQSGISSTPAMQFADPENLTGTIDGVYIEEVPSSTGGVQTVSIINPGYSYQVPPTITIVGDGSGANAYATLSGTGTIQSIVVTTPGSNYTSAAVVITPASYDTTGTGGAATVNLEGQYGTLRTYYINSLQVKTILNPNIGTVDYSSGTVTLNSFNPQQVDNPLGQLTLYANPTTTIISSSYNRIVTVDPYDPNALVVNVTAKV